MHFYTCICFFHATKFLSENAYLIPNNIDLIEFIFYFFYIYLQLFMFILWDVDA